MIKYNISLRILHWIVAIMIIALLAVGFYMVGLPKASPDKAMIYMYHKSFGVLALVLTAVRIVIKAATTFPRFPKEITPLEGVSARGGHYLLYIFMVIAPVSGLLMSLMGGHEVKLFGYLLPNYLPLDKATAGQAHSIHVTLPLFFVALIAIHLLAVVYHYLKARINVLKRIV